MDGDEHLTRDSSQSSCSNNEKVANTIDADESHKLLMQLDVDEQIDNDNNNDKSASLNRTNRKSGHNDIIEFDLTKALISPTNPFRLDFIQFERCRSNATHPTGESMRTKPNNNNNNNNIIEQHDDSCNIYRNDSMIINETTVNGKNRNNDIKYQRNSKSLGYLMLCKRNECNCRSSSSCNCLMHVNSLDLRRTKSSTGINHFKWSNEINDGSTNSGETLVNLNASTNKSSDSSTSTNNGKIIKMSVTNQIILSHQSQNNSIRNNFKEFIDARPTTLRMSAMSSQQKHHSQQMEKLTENKSDLVNCDNEINAKHPPNEMNDTKININNNNLQANLPKTSKNCASNGQRTNGNTIINNNADIFSLNTKACADKTIDGCDSFEHGNRSSMLAHQLLTNDNWKSIDSNQQNRSIIENWSTHNIEHDLIANAGTNPFLEHGTTVAESCVRKNSSGNDGGNSTGQMERCETFGVIATRNDDEIHASNDVEETISNQFITNDDTISAKPTCKLNRLSTSGGDNERNIDDENVKRDLYYNESCSSRTRHKQKHDRMTNNLLEYENDNDDSNQWNAVPNHSATLMKYGNKKRRRKDVMNKDMRKHNHSTDNLSLIDGPGHQQIAYIEQIKSGRNKAYFHDKNIKQSAHVNRLQKNLDYFNELDQQLTNDDKCERQQHSYAAYTAKNQQQHIMKAMNDIPTCPFQRQDYSKPDNENQSDTGRTQRKSKKDLLLSFALQKGKYLSSTITRSGGAGAAAGVAAGVDTGVNVNENAIDGNSMRKTGNNMKTVNISNNSIPGATRTLTNTTTITHVPGKGSYLKKLNVGYANRLVSSSNTKQQSFHFRHKDDKTYFDKTKKSLLKIGQKCGLKLNNSLSGGIQTTNKYESCSLREPLTAFDRDGHRYTNHRPVIVEKVPYKSYRSEMDLTKNLHYLDAFLNENFDKLSKPKDGSHSIGKCSMPSSSSRDRKNSNAITFNDFQNRGHHRTQSYSEVSEFDAVNDSYSASYRNAAVARLSSEIVTMENSLGNNYTTTTAVDTMSTAMQKREFLVNSVNNSIGYRTPSINDDMNSIGQHHHGNQYVISSSTSESFSFKQQSLPIQSPNQASVQSNQKFTFAKDFQSMNHTNAVALSNCERSAKSQTTSSSLSSSDYASVYSPSSEKHYQTQTAMTKLNNELSFKQKRFLPIGSGQYQKRNSFTGADIVYDDRSTSAKYLSETRLVNCIDGSTADVAADSDSDADDDDDENFENNFNDCCNYVRNPSQSDKLQLLEKSLYQYENKLPYHEDYLQHYYSNTSGTKRASTSNASIQNQSQFPSIASSSYPYSQESQLNYAKSTSNLPSGSTHPYYAHEVTIRKQPNYPQNRVVITKQKNNHSNINDVVLEYEC